MKGDDILERFVSVAVSAVKIVESCLEGQRRRQLGDQLVRAVTSSGANYQEARGAESKKDFVHKLGVALKETREAHYWLRLVHGLGAAPEEQLRPLLQETNELGRILTSSIKTARARLEE